MSTDRKIVVPDFNDLTPVEMTVPIQGKKYILREASGEDGVFYRNAIVKCTKFGANGQPSAVENLHTTELLLVSRCLYETDETGNIKLNSAKQPVRVSETLIKTWPYHVFRWLFETARDISNLGEAQKGIDERIVEMRKQLDELEAQKAKGDPTNGLLVTTTAGSE